MFLGSFCQLLSKNRIIILFTGEALCIKCSNCKLASRKGALLIAYQLRDLRLRCVSLATASRGMTNDSAQGGVLGATLGARREGFWALLSAPLVSPSCLRRTHLTSVIYRPCVRRVGSRLD